MTNIDLSNLSNDRQELQDNINKLINEFEKKYYLQGVRLTISTVDSQEEKNKNGGGVKCSVMTGMAIKP